MKCFTDKSMQDERKMIYTLHFIFILTYASDKVKIFIQIFINIMYINLYMFKELQKMFPLGTHAPNKRITNYKI